MHDTTVYVEINKSKKEGNDQESLQSSTTADAGHHTGQ